MKILRRNFLKSSLALSAAAAVSGSARAATAGTSTSGREYYDLRAYRLKAGASADLLDGYLEKALMPALAQRGIKDVGVFTEIDVNKEAVTSTPKTDSPVW